YRICRAQLEILLGTHFGEESGEMEIPVFERNLTAQHPLPESPIRVGLVTAAHGVRIQRKTQVIRDRVAFVEGERRPRVVEGAPEMRAIAGVVHPLAGVAR